MKVIHQNVSQPGSTYNLSSIRFQLKKSVDVSFLGIGEISKLEVPFQSQVNFVKALKKTRTEISGCQSTDS